MRDRILLGLATAGIVGLGGVSVVAVSLLIVISLFALITAVQALLLWLVWNFVGPMFDFVPVAYQHYDYMQVWGAVAVVRIIGRVLFGTVKGKQQ